MDYKSPGVFIEEISTFPPSVAQVETAIPAFVGHTEFTKNDDGQTVTTTPFVKRIKSYKEYETFFGLPQATAYTLTATNGALDKNFATPSLVYRMAYSVQLYFDNGGGPCYICSVGDYTTAIQDTDLKAGLDAIRKEDEPTILVVPDALGVNDIDLFYGVYKHALTQCGELGDRVALIDLYAPNGNESFESLASNFRTKIGNNYLKYGIAYYPYLQTSINPYYNQETLTLGGDTLRNLSNEEDPTTVYFNNNQLYFETIAALAQRYIVLPPSAAIAGIYARVDESRGVWKAPANVSLNFVKKAMVDIDNADQEDMNVDTTGKSVNAIRQFKDRGILVWGARTLAGNDNEWRYVNVRRFFNMVEESVKKATEAFVFAPNDANTWTKVRSMIENFLTLQWRAGALAGAKADDAFFVKVGLGQTMTPQDILEGRMIVEIGMAAVRPAEFIILRFSHLLPTA